MAVPVTEPGAEHQQSAEEHRVAGHHRTCGRGRGVEVAQHRRQRDHDDGDAQDVDELDQAEHANGHPAPDRGPERLRRNPRAHRGDLARRRRHHPR
jgi:hypothetical protein